jgi:hypothetical protein
MKKNELYASLSAAALSFLLSGCTPQEQPLNYVQIPTVITRDGIKEMAGGPKSQAETELNTIQEACKNFPGYIQGSEKSYHIVDNGKDLYRYAFCDIEDDSGKHTLVVSYNDQTGTKAIMKPLIYDKNPDNGNEGCGWVDGNGESHFILVKFGQGYLKENSSINTVSAFDYNNNETPLIYQAKTDALVVWDKIFGATRVYAEALESTVTPTSIPTRTATLTPTETKTPTATLTDTETVTPEVEVQLGLPESYDKVPTVQEKDLAEFLPKLSEALWKIFDQKGSNQTATFDNSFGIVSFRNFTDKKITTPIPVEFWSWTKIKKADGSQVDLIGVPFTKGVTLFWYDGGEQAEKIYPGNKGVAYINTSSNIFKDVGQQKVRDFIFSLYGIGEYRDSTLKQYADVNTPKAFMNWAISEVKDCPPELRKNIFEPFQVGNIVYEDGSQINFKNPPKN